MDDLNVDNYNIDDIFELVDVEKYDFEELIKILDVYSEAYTNENNIILTNFILQIKSKVTDYIQTIGLENEAESSVSEYRKSNYNLNKEEDSIEDTNMDDINSDDNNNNVNSIESNQNMQNMQNIKNMQNMQNMQKNDFDKNSIMNKIINMNDKSESPNSKLGFLDDYTLNNNFLDYTSNMITDNKSNDNKLNDNDIDGLNRIKSMNNLVMELDEQSQVNRLEKNINNNLNPLEEDYIEKVLIFNSEFRKPSESINDYLIDMSEPLQNVVSLQLTSYTLTYNIYNIDDANTTNVIYITDSDFNEHKIKVKSGYYRTPATLIEKINESIQNNFNNQPYGKQWNNSQQPVVFIYDELNGKVSIQITKPLRDGNGNATSEPFVIYVTFFSLSSDSNIKYNFNLGYFLGFRRFFLNSTKGLGYYVEFLKSQELEGITDTNNDSLTNIYPSEDGSFNMIESEGIVDLQHPKYLMLSLDEYNQNRSNSNVIQVNDATNNIVRDVISKMELPKNPRQKPLAHIYAHNERIVANINELRKQAVRNYPKTIPDSFADIPFPADKSLGLVINNQGQNTASIPPRKYFGPINIKRFRVRLYDEKGNLVNLNNTDYSFSVKLKMLYNKNVVNSLPKQLDSLNNELYQNNNEDDDNDDNDD